MSVVVVGAGAAGLVAAWRSALAGRETLLLEANPHEGAKIRISGGGKCNLTHAGSLRELLAAFPPAQARFLRPSLHAFSAQDLVALLLGEGVPTYARADGRVFPFDAPGSARLVVEALRNLALRAGVRVRTGVRVEGLETGAGRVLGVRSGRNLVEAEDIILATGGASYPRTGSRGEALGWLRDLGLPVQPWFPALAPIPLRDPLPDWEGVAFRGGELRLRGAPGGPVLGRSAGAILFTRSGISGPAALDLSEQVEHTRRAARALLDYAFVKDAADLKAGFLAELETGSGLSARRWIGTWIPERVAAALLQKAGLPADVRLHRIGKAQRDHLLAAICGFDLGETGPVPLERGEVCAGGLDLAAVDPRTLRVHGWNNLRVCGELLDVNGPIGGYNLQAAFSTGFSAGNSL